MKKLFLLALFIISIIKINAQDHVTLNDGEVIEGRIVETKLITTTLNFANISVNGEKYKITKIKSYLKGNNYMVNIKDFYFMKAQIHGKINVIHVESSYRDFSKMSTTGSVSRDVEYYLIQKGEDGKLESISYKNLEEMISDNPEVMAKYNTMEKKKDGYYGSKKQDAFIASIIEIVEMYNKN